MPDQMEFQEIRAAGMFPAALSLKHRDTQVVLLDNYMRRSLTMLHGIADGVANLARVDANEALRITSFGTGFRYAEVIADTAPASYSSSHEINDGNEYHRFDVLVETEQAEVRFLQADGTNSGDIPLVVGFHSLLVSTTQFQVQKRNTTAGTYTITAFR